MGQGMWDWERNAVSYCLMHTEFLFGFEKVLETVFERVPDRANLQRLVKGLLSLLLVCSFWLLSFKGCVLNSRSMLYVRIFVCMSVRGGLEWTVQSLPHKIHPF